MKKILIIFPILLMLAGCGSQITKNSTTTSLSWNIQEVKKTWFEITYTNNKYWLSFNYPKDREIQVKEEAITSDPDCSSKLKISLADKSKPLQCFEAGCTPTTQPSIDIYIRNFNSCQWIVKTCKTLDPNIPNIQNICKQLMTAGMSEELAAKTASFWGANGADYNIIKGDYANILKWTFINGIITQSRAFLMGWNWYGVQIIDDAWMYGNVFDNFIKSFKFIN